MHPLPLARALACALAALLLAAAPAAADFTTPLPIPQVLTGSNITIPVKEADVQILPGAKTHMWTYDGTFPGPTIRRPAGQRTRVRFVNQLPSGTGSLSVHLHGGHSSSADDGQPDQTAGQDLLIAPGDARTYTYDLTQDGAPERAAFEWYHDHRLDVTGRNVWNGLAGMFIVDDAVDQALPLPDGAQDVPLMIVDRSFDAGNQLTYPAPVPFGSSGRSYPGTGVPPNDALTGDHLLVNGAYQPYFDVAARRYRLRLLNASNSRVLTFALAGGLVMDQIATESGLLPAPVQRSSITLGPAERAEVVVDFAGHSGEGIALQSDAGDVMQFRVGAPPDSDPSSVPAVLRPPPDLGTPVKTRRFNLALVEDDDPARGRKAWALAGQPYAVTRVDARPVIGTTEQWTFTAGANTHTIHIHAADFEVVSRNGEPPPAWEAGLKETVLISPHEQVVLRLRFTDNLGAFIFHCHVLEHEDNGMMASYAVGTTDVEQPTPTPPGTQPDGPTPTPAPSPTPTPSAPTADVALRWVDAPRRLVAGRRTRLRLRATNRGAGPAAAGAVSVTLARTLTASGARNGKLKLRLPALAAGRSTTLALYVRATRTRRGGARLVAKRGGAADGDASNDRAVLAYARARGILRLSASASSLRAAGLLLCPLA